MTFKVVPISKIVVGSRVRKDMSGLLGLQESIRERGLLNPLTVDPKLNLLAGGRRLEALRRLGFEEVPVNVVSTAVDALAAALIERDENTCRKDFTPEEAVRAGRLIEELEKPKAIERKREGNARGGQGEVGGKLPPTSKPAKTRAVAAKAVGMGERSYDKAKTVVEAAENEELPAAIREEAIDALNEMNRTGKVDKPFQRVKKATSPLTPILEAIEDDAEMQRLKFRKAVLDGYGGVSKFLAEFDTARVGPVIESDEWERWDQRKEAIDAWFDRLNEYRPKPGLRVVGEN